MKPPSVIAITSKTARPHGAALLLDYYLSKPAHEIMAHKQGALDNPRRRQVADGTQEPIRCCPTQWVARYNDVVEFVGASSRNQSGERDSDEIRKIRLNCRAYPGQASCWTFPGGKSAKTIPWSTSWRASFWMARPKRGESV